MLSEDSATKIPMDNSDSKSWMAILDGCFKTFLQTHAEGWRKTHLPLEGARYFEDEWIGCSNRSIWPPVSCLQASGHANETWGREKGMLLGDLESGTLQLVQ